MDLIFKSKELDADVEVKGENFNQTPRIVDRSDTSLVAKGNDLSAEIDFLKKRVTQGLILN